MPQKLRSPNISIFFAARTCGQTLLLLEAHPVASSRIVGSTAVVLYNEKYSFGFLSFSLRSRCALYIKHAPKTKTQCFIKTQKQEDRRQPPRRVIIRLFRHSRKEQQSLHWKREKAWSSKEPYSTEVRQASGQVQLASMPPAPCEDCLIRSCVSTVMKRGWSLTRISQRLPLPDLPFIFSIAHSWGGKYRGSIEVC